MCAVCLLLRRLFILIVSETTRTYAISPTDTRHGTTLCVVLVVYSVAVTVVALVSSRPSAGAHVCGVEAEFVSSPGGMSGEWDWLGGRIAQ